MCMAGILNTTEIDVNAQMEQNNNYPKNSRFTMKVSNTLYRSHNIKKVCDLSFVAVDKDILYRRHISIWPLLQLEMTKNTSKFG